MADGSSLGGFNAYGWGVSDWSISANYNMRADGAHSGSNLGGYHQWRGVLNGSTSLAEWMRLQGGNLGVGVAPTAGNGLLQLASGTTKANGIAFGTDTFLYRSGASLVRLDSAQMIGSGVGFTNGAGSGAGTLTNAPVAGNPTKWVPINDNGTTRYIPAW
jgi:hypothetical protein